MNKLFDVANRYIETSDWKIIAVLKFCLISLGVMLGMTVSEKYRKPVLLTALAVFFPTYSVLMLKFYKTFAEYTETEAEEEDSL